MLNAITDPTPEQEAAWTRYVQARREAGKPIVVEVNAPGLRRGDVLAGGGTLTSEISRHPCGVVVVEVDHRTLLCFDAGQGVHIYERSGGRR